jgi:meso-butanediol dehydrogenase / (S,S)-butanediol dehydrogenase / diacetyl reductase
MQPVCVLTGGTSGIGLETAKRFAQEGYRIVICGREKSRLEKARHAISLAGGGSEVLAVEWDLSRPREAGKFIDRAVEAYSGVNVLVHCAAVAPLKALEEMSSQEFENALDVNVRAPFYLTQAAWSVMLRQANGGIIVNVSSLSAVDPFPGFSVYGASKAWSDLFCTALAQEGKPRGIRVYSIRPGAVETPMLRSLFPDFPASQALPAKSVADMIWAVCQDAFRDSSGYPLSIRR